MIDDENRFDDMMSVLKAKAKADPRISDVLKMLKEAEVGDEDSRDVGAATIFLPYSGAEPLAEEPWN